MGGAIDTNSEEYKQQQRMEAIRDAKCYIADCEWMITQLENNPDFAVEIKIGNITVGLTDQPKNVSMVTHLLQTQIHEAQKCIAGEPNGYE